MRRKRTEKAAGDKNEKENRARILPGKNFRRLFLSYLLILALPLAVMALAVGSYLTTLRESEMSEYAAVLERRVDAMDDILIGFEHFANALSENTMVESLYNADEVRADIPSSMIWKNIPSMYSYSAINAHYVERMLILFRKNGLVIGRNGMYYTNLWTYDYVIEGRTLSEWKTLTDAGEGSYCLPVTDNEGRQFFAYVTSLPVGFSSNPRANVILLVERAKIDTLLRAGAEESLLAVRRADGTNLIICGDETLWKSAQQAENGQRCRLSDGRFYTAFRMVSAYNGWRYTWLVPSEQLEAKTNGVISLFLAILAGILFIGGCAATALAWLRNKPVREIEGMLRESGAQENGEDEYDVIRKNLRVLIDRHQTLETLLHRNEELVRDSIMTRLLTGKSMAESGETLRDRLGFPAEARYYAVILLRITDKIGAYGLIQSADEEIQIQNSILTSFAVTACPGLLVQSMEMNKIAVICAEETRESCEKSAEQCAAGLLEKIMKKGHTNVAVGIGESVSGLDRLYQSYEAARLVSGRLKPGELGEGEKDDVSRSQGGMEYSLADEQRLISLVNRGEAQECACFLDALLDKNRRTGGSGGRLFEMELIGTLHKLSAYRPEEETFCLLLRRFEECDGGLLQELTRQFLLACERAGQGTSASGRKAGGVSAAEKGEAEALTTRITVFLEQEYANQALSLSLLSERFDLSEAYLSHLFKEQTGENFSACLERICMNRAHTLLSMTDLPVDVIAERIGYNSGDTFRRAFRRFHGITPGAYRNSTRQE